MVRLLSVLIVLLVPNLFVSQAPDRAVRSGDAPPSSTPSAHLARTAPAIAGGQREGPALAQGKLVPTSPAVPAPRAHPTLEPSFDR
jgi:hypothetical protein